VSESHTPQDAGAGHEPFADVELRRRPGLIHAFMLLDGISLVCDAAADLRDRLAVA
jgi:hypothetical protein